MNIGDYLEGDRLYVHVEGLGNFEVTLIGYDDFHEKYVGRICKDQVVYFRPKNVHVVLNRPEKKPPIGIAPSYIWKQHRLKALCQVIGRYSEVGNHPKKEWLEEALELYNELEK